MLIFLLSARFDPFGTSSEAVPLLLPMVPPLRLRADTLMLEPPRPDGIS